ncbi:Methyltransferase [Gracilaria domingensis]|nr:Methyltransferase [Gracilaria domingensis]
MSCKRTPLFLTYPHFSSRLRKPCLRVRQAATGNTQRKLFQCSLTRRQVLLGTFCLPSPLLGYSEQPDYDDFAETYDELDGSNYLTNLLGFTDLRSELLSRATGRVLETGIGTGVNIPYYDSKKVVSITGIDLSSAMLAKALQRSKRYEIPVTLSRASADMIDFPDSSFDTIVDTFCLCVYESPMEVLEEMRRLVKPGGRVLLLEHSVSTNRIVAAYQDLIARPNAVLSKGCYSNQRVVDMAVIAGFKPIRIRSILEGTIISLELDT